MCRRFSQTCAAVLAKLVGVTFVARLFSVTVVGDLVNVI